MSKTYRLEDDLLKKTRPRWGSARWSRLYAICPGGASKCEICGAMLFNPQSILIHQGGFCQGKMNSEQNPERSVARNDAQSDEAGKQK